MGLRRVRRRGFVLIVVDVVRVCVPDADPKPGPHDSHGDAGTVGEVVAYAQHSQQDRQETTDSNDPIPRRQRRSLLKLLNRSLERCDAAALRVLGHRRTEDHSAAGSCVRNSAPSAVSS